MWLGRLRRVACRQERALRALVLEGLPPGIGVVAGALKGVAHIVELLTQEGHEPPSIAEAEAALS